MTTKRQLLQGLKGERVTIYTVEKEFTGVLREFDNEFSISNAKDTVRIKPGDIANVKRLSMMPVIFVRNHFSF